MPRPQLRTRSVLAATVALSLSFLLAGTSRATAPGGTRRPRRIHADCRSCHLPLEKGGTPASRANLLLPKLRGGAYRMYRTKAGNVGRLDGPSRLCMTCHDGVTARGGHFPPGTRKPYSLGTDLSNDHPVGVPYPPRDRRGRLLRGYRPVPWPPVKLVVVNGERRVECTSCHDPHGGPRPYDLRETTWKSRLCFACHDL